MVLFWHALQNCPSKEAQFNLNENWLAQLFLPETVWTLLIHIYSSLFSDLFLFVPIIRDTSQLLSDHLFTSFVQVSRQSKRNCCCLFHVGTRCMWTYRFDVVQLCEVNAPVMNKIELLFCLSSVNINKTMWSFFSIRVLYLTSGSLSNNTMYNSKVKIALVS